MKPRDSSDEEHDPVGPVPGESGNWGVAPAQPPPGSARTVSGVVAAPEPKLDRFREEDDEATTVGPAHLPVPEDQQAALSRRIRTALGQTLPLGTPVPGGAVSNGLRRTYARTMLLGGRQSPVRLPALPASSGRERLSEPPGAAAGAEPVRPSTPSSLPALPQPHPSEPSASDQAALRASFVRTVGPPTVPPPRRSRRPGATDSEPAPASEPAPESDSDNEPFVLDRPRMGPGVLAVGRTTGEISASTAGLAGMSPARDETTSRAQVTGVMLPPPPQPADYEPASSPSSLPPAPRSELPSGPPAALKAARVSRAPAAVLLTDLPSVNPFDGFEAPRETFVQRFLLVFVVALAVVGLFALAAIAFGLLGKIGW